ncbi:MAG TPA: GNAT family N-acetyltransferase [Candidatus Polarisedimenticolia bacterium]|jgi:CelD/BcsL family acetyltransferase involved in cellulose biosynthesis|nr:GNAT family N-acetyltransferase [Candidatus Polarisedimenticolia bacterium]
MPLALAAPEQRPTAATELRVETITDWQGLLDLQPAWDALLEESGVDHPFLSHEWVKTWWECFGAAHELHVLMVRDGDGPVAIVPLMRSKGRFYGLPVRRLETIGNVHTQRFDVVSGRRRPEAYRAIWRTLLEQEALWDVLVLSHLPADSPTLATLTSLALGDGYLTGLWRSAEAPYIPIEGSWDEYFNRLSPKLRANLRRRERRLQQFGDIRMEVVGSGPDVWDALEDGLWIESAGWKGRAGTAIAADEATHRFYSLLALRAARRGWLRLHFLTVGERRIAFDFSLFYAGKAFLLKPAYDPAFAACSPYSQLLARILQDHFDRGVKEFDFLGQEDAWKFDWATRTRSQEWLYVMPDSPRMRLLHFTKFRIVPRLRRHRALVVTRDAARVLAATWTSRGRGARA